MALVLPMTLALRRRLPEEASEASGAVRAGHRATRCTPGQLQWMQALAGIGRCVDLAFGPAIGAEMLSLILLGGVASRLVSGMLADRLEGVMTLLIGSLGQCVALILYLPADGLMSLHVVSLTFGLLQGGIVPSYASILREYLPAREAGARVGFVRMATILGMALGGWMSGWIRGVTGSCRMAFVKGIALNLLNIGIILIIPFSTRSRPGLRPAAA